MSEIRQRPPVQKSAMPRRQERKYLDTLRGKSCWGCGVQDETIVPCHLNLTDGAVEIMGTHSIQSQLVVEPRVSNVVRIRVR